MPVRIAVDAMGGDGAPRAIIQGAVDALSQDPDFELLLVGDEERIGDELALRQSDRRRIRIVHAAQVIPMDAAPVEALRLYKDSSLVRLGELAAAGEADAILSAGNTGACAAVAQLKLRPLPFVTRPGVAVTIPAFHGPLVLCDVGANIQARPRHLHEYALLASVYAQRVLGVGQPRVAVLSIGEESGKGTGLIKRTHELLRGDPSVSFVGNVEGRELLDGRCDVAVCDGFVGNVVLKLVEGLVEGWFRAIDHELAAEPADLRDRLHAALDRVARRHDYSQYGGAPLLGVHRTCIICHGRSNAVAIRNAIGMALRFVRQDFHEALAARFEACPA